VYCSRPIAALLPSQSSICPTHFQHQISAFCPVGLALRHALASRTLFSTLTSVPEAIIPFYQLADVILRYPFSKSDLARKASKRLFSIVGSINCNLIHVLSPTLPVDYFNSVKSAMLYPVDPVCLEIYLTLLE